jgi:hypothetical protein
MVMKTMSATARKAKIPTARPIMRPMFTLLALLVVDDEDEVARASSVDVVPGSVDKIVIVGGGRLADPVWSGSAFRLEESLETEPTVTAPVSCEDMFVGKKSVGLKFHKDDIQSKGKDEEKMGGGSFDSIKFVSWAVGACVTHMTDPVRTEFDLSRLVLQYRQCGFLNEWATTLELHFRNAASLAMKSHSLGRARLQHITAVLSRLLLSLKLTSSLVFVMQARCTFIRSSSGSGAST